MMNIGIAMADHLSKYNIWGKCSDFKIIASVILFRADQLAGSSIRDLITNKISLKVGGLKANIRLSQVTRT